MSCAKNASSVSPVEAFEYHGRTRPAASSTTKPKDCPNLEALPFANLLASRFISKPWNSNQKPQACHMYHLQVFFKMPHKGLVPCSLSLQAKLENKVGKTLVCSVTQVPPAQEASCPSAQCCSPRAPGKVLSWTHPHWGQPEDALHMCLGGKQVVLPAPYFPGPPPRVGGVSGEDVIPILMVVPSAPSTGEWNSPQAKVPLPAEAGGQSSEQIQVTKSRPPLVPYLLPAFKSAVLPQPPITPLVQSDCYQVWTQPRQCHPEEIGWFSQTGMDGK